VAPLIKGTLLIAALVVGGGIAGYLLGSWWVDARMPNAGLEALGPMMIGTIAGAGAGLVGGLVLLFGPGRREPPEV
jgi:cation transporter-like permease